MKNKTSKPKHTKGPWLITTIDGEDCLMVGGGDGSEVVADIRTHWPDAQVEANANLIASAPEMLEALRAVLEYHEELKRAGQWWMGKGVVGKKIQTAIAHAEGRDYHGEVAA